MAAAGTSIAKTAIRTRLLAQRQARPQADREAAAQGLCRQALSLLTLGATDAVAAYVAGAGEPDTRPLLAALLERATPVLLPLLREDFDLDWALLTGLDHLRPGRFGILEPTTDALGLDAIRQVSLVICPGVAGDLAGRRLGRGGGSYDRVLARLAPGVTRCLLLHDDEVLDEVPADGHDQPVDVLVTPTRVLPTSTGRL